MNEAIQVLTALLATAKEVVVTVVSSTSTEVVGTFVSDGQDVSVTLAADKKYSAGTKLIYVLENDAPVVSAVAEKPKASSRASGQGCSGNSRMATNDVM